MVESQQCVLITGGSAGIGLATALRFAGQGHHVMVCGRDPARIKAAGNQMKAAAQRNGLTQASNGSTQAISGLTQVITAAVVCDLSDPAQCAQLVPLAIQKLGQVDVLINNAASAPLSPFEETLPAEFERVLSVNLRAAWTVTQRVWSTMTARRSGVVINLSSMAAVDPFSGFSLYGASKGWSETWTKALADEGSRKGIRVYGVRPGAVETDLLRKLFPDFPAEQCVSPETVAGIIYRLATTDQHPTGTILTVDKDTCSQE